MQETGKIAPCAGAIIAFVVRLFAELTEKAFEDIEDKSREHEKRKFSDWYVHKLNYILKILERVYVYRL